MTSNANKLLAGPCWPAWVSSPPPPWSRPRPAWASTGWPRGWLASGPRRPAGPMIRWPGPAAAIHDTVKALEQISPQRGPRSDLAAFNWVAGCADTAAGVEFPPEITGVDTAHTPWRPVWPRCCTATTHAPVDFAARPAVSRRVRPSSAGWCRTRPPGRRSTARPAPAVARPPQRRTVWPHGAFRRGAGCLERPNRQPGQPPRRHRG